MSDKLRSQCGQMTSYSALPAGDQWSMTMTLGFKCAKFDRAGIVLSFNTKTQLLPNSEYSCARFEGTFGMNHDLSGLGLTLHNNNAYVGQYNSTNILREHLTHWSKACKASFRKDNEITLVVRNRFKNLSIYLVDVKTQSETLCVQMDKGFELDHFYFGISAFDNGGQCDAFVSQAEFSTDASIEEVNPENKKIGDSFFAFYSKNEVFVPDMTHFSKVYDYHRQYSRIMVDELLDFADRNEKEVVDELNLEYQSFKHNLTSAMTVLEKEAEQISLLSSILIEDRKNSTSATSEMLNQVLDWLDAMKDAYSRVNNETLRIFETIQSLSVDSRVDNILAKTSMIIGKLDAILSQTVNSFESSKLAEADSDQITAWSGKMETLASDLKSKLSEHKNTSGSALRKLGVFLLGTIVFIVFLSFGYLYWKIKKAAEFKRIL